MPFLRLEQGIPDAYTLPAGLESREAAVAIQEGFEAGTTAPIIALVDVAGDPTSEEDVRALAAYGAQLAGIEGVERVESPFTGIPNPATGVPLTADELVALYAQPREAWPPQLAGLWDRYVHESTVRFDAISPLQPSSPAGTAVVGAVRAVDPGDGLTAMIGGQAATGHDFLVSQTERSRTPWASC